MKYYVVADVHGFYTPLEKVLRDAGFFDETEPCRLVVCGDLLDRGPEARQMVDFMLRLAEENKLIYVLGNHEDLLSECLQQIAGGDVYGIAAGMSHHYTNGTWDTLLQISELSATEAYKAPRELVRRVLNSPYYKKLLPLGVDYYETPRYIFTHGWIPARASGYGPYASYTYDPSWREADEEQWHRARWYNGMQLACKQKVLEPGKTIVCGHWHASYGHAHIHRAGSEWGPDAIFEPFTDHGIIALDACTKYSGQVNCVLIED